MVLGSPLLGFVGVQLHNSWFYFSTYLVFAGGAAVSVFGVVLGFLLHR